jgi:hypothetical protein
MPEPRRIVPDGAVRAGLNTGGAQIPKCRIVRRHTLTDSVRLCSAATQQPLGVSMADIEEDVTGDIQTTGKTIIETGAAVAKGSNQKLGWWWHSTRLRESPRGHFVEGAC